jgi:hypothetical protein
MPKFIEILTKKETLFRGGEEQHFKGRKPFPSCTTMSDGPAQTDPALASHPQLGRSL